MSKYPEQSVSHTEDLSRRQFISQAAAATAATTDAAATTVAAAATTEGFALVFAKRGDPSVLGRPDSLDDCADQSRGIESGCCTSTTHQWLVFVIFLAPLLEQLGHMH